MSWLYLPGLVADCLQADYLVGEQSAPLKSTNTASKSYCNVSGTDASINSPFGTTLEHSTGDRGVDAWTLFLRASRANRSALPGEEKPTPTNATDGRIPFASLTMSNRIGYCWRMCQAFFHEVISISERFLETWPRSGMTQGGVCYRLPEVERLTFAKGSGLLPTPVVNEFTSNVGGSNGRVGKVRYSLTGMARYAMWPTPSASKASSDTTLMASGDGRKRPNKLGWAVAAEMVPTPASRDWRAPNKKPYSERGGGKKGEQLPNAIGGLLNPNWVEWLMGWPIGWTDLKPLEMDKFQSWLQGHGMNCKCEGEA